MLPSFHNKQIGIYEKQAPNAYKKGMSFLIPLTIIQTVKNIILWSQMVTEFTITIAFSIEFHLYKPVKTPLNQRFSRSSAGRAPP
ncbi:hypothetical protein CN475_22865 [Bacillus cereus]|uniref:Uncharacterized protein n=1 Tax=Bacillus cereus TaxID=1396 RepID=A0A9X6UJL6_BACCE|nr:hypothetical protein CN475_22865 [Bacillus cereus]